MCRLAIFYSAGTALMAHSSEDPPHGVAAAAQALVTVTPGHMSLLRPHVSVFLVGLF